VRLFNSGGSQAALLGSSSAGRGEMNLRTSSGATRVAAGVDDSNGGFLELFDGDGNATIQMFGDNGLTESGGVLYMRRPDGTAALTLRSAPTGATIVSEGSIDVDRLFIYGQTHHHGDLDVSANLYVSGEVWCDEVIESSDERLKDVGPAWTAGLDEVRRLRPVSYQYKKGNPKKLNSDKTHTGVLAQELSKVLPEAVISDKDGYLAVSTTPVLWSLVNACKELDQQNKTAAAEQARMEAGNEALRRRVEAMEKRLDALIAK